MDKAADRNLSARADPTAGRLVTGLVKISLANRYQAWNAAEDEGLTPLQGQALALLRLHPVTGLRLTALAAALAVTPATASAAVSTLDRKGLVAKSRAAPDRRAVAIRLTETGRLAADRAAGWSDFLLDAVDVLTPSEREVVLRALVKMIWLMQQRGQIPISRMCVTCRFFRPHVHADPANPHHCAFVDAPFGDRQLRLECGDHDPAPPAQAAAIWATFDEAAGDGAPGATENWPPGAAEAEPVAKRGGLDARR
jgi:DNA-binding MarR family transcriptional regulator